MSVVEPMRTGHEPRPGAGGRSGWRTAVFVSRQRLIGATNGSSAYLLAIAKTLSACGYRVHLVQPTPAIAGRTPLLKTTADMDVFARHDVRGAVRLGRFFVFASPSIWYAALLGVARRVLRRLGFTADWAQDRPAAYSVATRWTAADIEFARRAIAKDADLVIADYVFCVSSLELAPPHARTAILMHDLFHSRDGNGEDSVATLSKSEEVRMLEQAQAVFAIQATEKAFVEDNVPRTVPILAPMPADPVDRPQPGADDRILFVGSFTAPNVVGLRWFLTEIWPQICTLRPRAQLYVAGTVCRAFDEPIAGVEFAGLVPDLGVAYADAGVVISPLTFGSGLKIKLIEAMAQGKAIVATPITLQGVEQYCEQAVHCTSLPSEFAHMVADLLGARSEREQSGARALAVVRENFATEPVHRELREWLVGSAK